MKLSRRQLRRLINETIRETAQPMGGYGNIPKLPGLPGVDTVERVYRKVTAKVQGDIEKRIINYDHLMLDK